MGKTKKHDSLSMYDAYKRMRQTWKINPKTRVKDSSKKYKRSRAKQNFRREMENDS